MTTRGDTAIRLTMVAAVTGVAAVAAWASYEHTVRAVEAFGAESSEVAHLLPATVDGLLAAASMTMLFCARYEIPVPRLARFALGIGIGATLCMNCLHAIQRGVVASVIAAWPAVALVVSFELLTWMLRTGRRLTGEPSGSTVPVDAPDVVPEQIGRHRKRQSVPPEQKAAEVNPAPPPDEERMRVAREALAQNPKMSGAAIGRLVGCSDRHGARLRRAVLAELAEA